MGPSEDVVKSHGLCRRRGVNVRWTLGRCTTAVPQLPVNRRIPGTHWSNVSMLPHWELPAESVAGGKPLGRRSCAAGRRR